MIPRTIHYCWFGGASKPKSVERCIDSWKKYCPDFEIVEWNEKNFDVSQNLYCKQAYDARKWAFATDYARLSIIYQYGGIYLDTDVEVIRPLDPLLAHDCFIGRQPGFQVNTGAGFGACAGHPVIKRMIDDYEGIPFVKDNGELDLWTCPHRNSQWLFENGLHKDDSFQEIHGVAIYPIEYFSPKDAYTRSTHITTNTYSIHHCDGSWNPAETKSEHRRRYIKHCVSEASHFLTHIPNKILNKILGKQRYNRLKDRLKGR